MAGCAWVTLATNDSYSLGALVLAHSLRKSNTAHQIAVLITPAVSPPMREQLEALFDVVKVVDVLDSKDEANLALLKRPELGVTFTKLHCWTLTQFTKAVFLDADTLVVRNSDDLFDRDEFSAAPDVGWPDCFNSGVFVFRPSVETFNNLIKFAVEKGSFDGGDQGLLNSFFNTWATDDIRKHLPFVYNLTSVAVYSYIPAFKQYGADTRIVHFIGPVKPWLQPVDSSSRTVQPAADSAHLQPLLQHWWDIFIEKVHPTLSSNLDRASGMLLAIFAQLEGTPLLEPSLPPPAPAFPEPYTPYIEKDDARQYNLPYQPFQVVSNEGELLNFTFAEFARELDNPEPPQPEETVQEPEEPPPPAPPVEEVQPEPQEEAKQPEPYHKPPPPVPESPFSYHRFVPDESVISAYMEHNIQQYQPYEVQAPQPPEEPPLPRFLTIPEDDPRQGHVPYHREPSPERRPEQQWQSWHMPQEQSHQNTWQNDQQSWQHNQSVPVEHHQDPGLPAEDHSMSRSKSMSNLMMIDATDTASFQGMSHWKSQPEIAPTETKKLPGLKPLKPKDKTPTKVAPMPRFTEFTEFFMVNQFRDAFAPPADKVGFVERAILKRAQSQKGLFDVPQGGLEPPKPAPAEKPSATHFHSLPEMNEYVDLSHCKRQAGNVPKKQESTVGKENLQPEKPAKRSSHRRTKRSTKKSVERKKTPEPCNVSYDVDAILQRLSTLSTGYAAIVPPAPKEPVITNIREKTPQPSENHGNRLFRESSPKSFSSPKKSAADGVVGTSQQFDSVKRKAAKKTLEKNGDVAKRFGPWNGVPMEEKKSLLSPFAAPAGHSLSESEGLVPEIVVCAATPMEENAPQVDPLANRLDLTFIVDKSEEMDEKNSLEIPVSKPAEDKVVNGTHDPVDDIEVKIKKMSLVDLELKVDYNPLNGSGGLTKEANVPLVSNVDVGVAFDGIGGEQSVEEVREVLPTSEAPAANGDSGECKKRDEYEVDLMFAKVTLKVEIDDPKPVETEVEKSDGLKSAEVEENVTEENGNDEGKPEVGTSVAAEVKEETSESMVEKVLMGADESKVSEPEVSGERFSVTEVETKKLSEPEANENWTVTTSGERSSVVDEIRVEEVEVGATKRMVDEKQCYSVLCHANVLCKNAYPNVPESKTLPGSDMSAAAGISMTVDNVQNNVKIGLKMDLSEKHPNDVTLANLETSSPSKVSEVSFQNGTAKTPLPIIPQSPSGLTYADAAKREGAPSLPPKEPTTVFYLPEAAQPAPVVSKGHKRPRREVKVPLEKTSPVSTVDPPSSPAKHKKRKSDKPEFEPPANRFELLPEEKTSGVVMQKKPKKVSKFAAPPGATYSLSLPSSSPPPDSIVRATPEETLYLPEPDDTPGIAGAIAQLSLEPGTETAGSSAAQTEYLRRQGWETGKMDYMGRDSFANIWSKISETLSQQAIPEPSCISPQRTPSPLATVPVSLSMILDDSIDTLPSDAATSPVGERADDDVIFDRRRSLEVRAEPPTLPGIAEESEEADDPPPLGDLPLCAHVVAPCVANIHGVVTANVIHSTQSTTTADSENTSSARDSPQSISIADSENTSSVQDCPQPATLADLDIAHSENIVSALQDCIQSDSATTPGSPIRKLTESAATVQEAQLLTYTSNATPTSVKTSASNGGTFDLQASTTESSAEAVADKASSDAETSPVKDESDDSKDRVTVGNLASFETIFVKTIDDSGTWDAEYAEAKPGSLSADIAGDDKVTFVSEDVGTNEAGDRTLEEPVQVFLGEPNTLPGSEQPTETVLSTESASVDDGVAPEIKSETIIADPVGAANAFPEELKAEQEVPPAIHSDTSAFAVYKPLAKAEEIPPKTIRRQTSNDDAKEKKGVFTKILEFVGVKKKEEEMPVASSIFYDDAVEEAVDASEGAQGPKTAAELSVEEEDVKKRSPSPRINIPNVPTTHVIEATPPAGPGLKPPRRDSDSLTVDNSIPDTPPVVEKKTPMIIEPRLREQLDRDVIMEEIDEIIAKAKLIAQDQIEDDPIYSNVLVSAATVTAPSTPPTALCEDFEEIKVTPQQERGRPKEATSSKLAGQILKAIPPPRRRPISSSRRSDGPSVEVQLDKNLDVVHETPPAACLERTQSVASSASPSVSPQFASEPTNSPPPVPPRRRKSKQRTDPEPPPKRKTKK